MEQNRNYQKINTEGKYDCLKKKWASVTSGTKSRGNYTGTPATGVWEGELGSDVWRFLHCMKTVSHSPKKSNWCTCAYAQTYMHTWT